MFLANLSERKKEAAGMNDGACGRKHKMAEGDVEGRTEKGRRK
jgi:hypothetical protein